MNILENKYYIIRKGNFATNGNTKIFYSIFSTILCMDDYINRNSKDCIFLLIGSTIIWSFVELFLHISKTRVIKPMYITLFGGKQELPQYLGIILQGFQEGGLITTLGLYFGDRLSDYRYLIFLHLFILFIISNIYIKKNTIKSSECQINTFSSVMLIGIATIYNSIKIYQHPQHLYRQLTMFSSMVYISSFWTFFAWYRGFRTIEIHLKKSSYSFIKNENENENNNTDNTDNTDNNGNNGNNNDNIVKYNIKKITAFDIFIIFAYDIFFEIGVAYLFFYNLFLI